MDRQSTDTDAGPESGIGVGVAGPTRSFYDAQPNWLVDGHGIRGPQRPYESPQQSRPDPMVFGLPRGGSGDPNQPSMCAPGPPPNSTDVFVWIVKAGVCQWAPVCNKSCT